jgi:hypothetical protein
MRVLLKNVQQILADLFQSKNRDKLQISKIPIQYLSLVSRHSSLITAKK